MTIAMNTDYFVAGTFKHATLGNNGEVKFYIKNLETDTWQTSSTINHSITGLNDPTADFNIGCYNNLSEKFPGLIDEVRWTDTVLSQGDLLAVPEPSTIVLLASGLLGLLLLRRRRK